MAPSDARSKVAIFVSRITITASRSVLTATAPGSSPVRFRSLSATTKRRSAGRTYKIPAHMIPVSKENKAKKQSGSRSSYCENIKLTWWCWRRYMQILSPDFLRGVSPKPNHQYSLIRFCRHLSEETLTDGLSKSEA